MKKVFYFSCLILGSFGAAGGATAHSYNSQKTDFFSNKKQTLDKHESNLKSLLSKKENLINSKNNDFNFVEESQNIDSSNEDDETGGGTKIDNNIDISKVVAQIKEITKEINDNVTLVNNVHQQLAEEFEEYTEEQINGMKSDLAEVKEKLAGYIRQKTQLQKMLNKDKVTTPQKSQKIENNLQTIEDHEKAISDLNIKIQELELSIKNEKNKKFKFKLI